MFEPVVGYHVVRLEMVSKLNKPENELVGGEASKALVATYSPFSSTVPFVDKTYLASLFGDYRKFRLVAKKYNISSFLQVTQQ